MPFGTLKLNSGHEIPRIAFGTGTALYGKNASQEVEQALESGFIHIDTAQMYSNEESVGHGLSAGWKDDRSKLFVTTKFSGGVIRDEFNKGLKALGTGYIDLYLIHFPRFTPDFGAAWKEFEKIHEEGLAKSIGVSNFNLQQLQEIIKDAKVKPAVNQIRFHPYNLHEHLELLEFCAKHDIIIEAYSPLTPITKQPGGPVDEPVAKAAKRLGATPAQVLMLWTKAKGAVIVTTSSKKERLKEYLDAGDLGELTQEEVEAIDRAGLEFANSNRK